MWDDDVDELPCMHAGRHRDLDLHTTVQPNIKATPRAATLWYLYADGRICYWSCRRQRHVASNDRLPLGLSEGCLEGCPVGCPLGCREGLLEGWILGSRLLVLVRVFVLPRTRQGPAAFFTYLLLLVSKA